MLKMRMLSILMILTGAGMVAFGIYVELTVRSQRGTGFKRFLGNLFYSGEIDRYRNLAFHFLFYAPALLLLGFGVWLLASWMRRRSDQKIIKEKMCKLKGPQQQALAKQGLSTRKLAKELVKMTNDQGTPASRGKKNTSKKAPSKAKASKRGSTKKSSIKKRSE